MNISLITDKISPFFNGGYEYAFASLAHIFSSTNEVTVYTSLGADNSFEGNIRYVKVCSSTLQRNKNQRNLLHSTVFSLSLFNEIPQILDSEFILVEAIPYIHLYSMSRWIHRSNGLKVLWVNEAWNSYSDYPTILGKAATYFIKRLLSRGAELFDLCVVGNSQTLKSLNQNYGVPLDKILTLPHGLWLENINKHRVNITKEYDLIFVGRLVGIKRVEDLIKAVKVLRDEKGLNVNAVVVGDGNMRKKLQRLTASYGLLNSISFTGFLPDERKYELLSVSKMFVLPSIREGLSISVMEALALGLPCIVAKPRDPEVFGPSDMVHDGYNGLYYSARDFRELANKIAYLLCNQDSFSRLSANCLKESRNFDWHNVADTLISRVSSMLRQGKH